MQNAGLEEAWAGIKIANRNINSLRYADDTTLMAESKEELKSLLMKMKEESRKAGLKLNIQKTKVMVSSPIASWKEWQILFSCAPKSLGTVTAAMKLKDACSLEESESEVKLLSCVQLFAIPRIVAYQAPLFMGLSRQEYWSELPFPSPGDLPNPGIGPRSPTLQVEALPSESPGYDKPRLCTRKKRHYFACKSLYSQSYGFSRSHVWMWKLDS